MWTKFKYLFVVLGLFSALLIITFVSLPDENLHIIACDVGQGDAILIKAKNTQLLIDGGKDDKLLDCLAKNMPFWDKNIEIVILTHQQIDHYGGLIEVFKAYSVDSFLVSPIDSSNQSFRLLKSLVGSSGTRIVNPTAGMVVRLGKIHLDIVHPNENFLALNTVNQKEVSGGAVLGGATTFRDPNDFSIVAILSFGNFDALFTGDIGPEISDMLAQELSQKGDKRKVEYIKVPHHGSKNGLTKSLLDVTKPKVAVISVGKNQWGHPHKEVIELLKEEGVKILRTDEIGDIELVTDGRSWWLK